MKYFEDEELNKILVTGCKGFVNANIDTIEEIQEDPDSEVFLVKMSPIILKYIHAKVGIFIKHIIAPNFNNYDLRLKFDEKKQQVEVEGFVYAKQFKEVNQAISRDPKVKMLPEIVNRILEKGTEVLPTATLSWRELSKSYDIDEVRAKKIIEVVQLKQYKEQVSPLSLLNLWTPHGWAPTERENILRGHALELCQEYAGEDTLDAILGVVVKLQEEGLFEELNAEQIGDDILLDLQARLTALYPDESTRSINALIWYHGLLLRTGGSNQWTLRRLCGEENIAPYHPLIVEALRQTVEVRTSLTDEYLEVEEELYAGEEGLLTNKEWREVSILKFMHGLSQVNYQEPTSQSTISVVSSQELERCFTESSERDEEIDDVFVNRRDESFIIVNGDLRKLYSKRPASMESITYAQFATSYYRLKPYQKAVIDPESDIGALTDEPIIGGEGRAPMYLRLSNKIMMKKRIEKPRPVPLLLSSCGLDEYGERMLFQPWRNLSELTEEATVEDRELQHENRLTLFPESIFPRPDNSSRRM